MSIVAVLAVLSWRGLDGMTSAQRHVRQQTDGLHALSAGLGQWRADWEALIERPGATTLDWSGNALRMVRPSQDPDAGGVIVVSWAARRSGNSSDWLRWQSRLLRTPADVDAAWARAGHWAQNPTDDERRGEVTVTSLTKWELFYFRENAWSNPSSSVGGDPASVVQAPEGVRLVLTLPPEQAIYGRVTYDWVRSTVGGGKS